MSVGAVLARLYYGHRPYRAEYIADDQAISQWQNECRASITAAKSARGLSDKDMQDLVMDAVYIAHGEGMKILLDDFMKAVLYGNSQDGKDCNEVTPLIFEDEEVAFNGLY